MADFIREIIQELNQLKAENEELNTVNVRLLGRLKVDETNTSLVFNLDRELRQKEKELHIAIQKVAKLKQALERIKDIVTQINFTVAGGYESPKHEWIRLYGTIVYEVSKIINEVE